MNCLELSKFYTADDRPEQARAKWTNAVSELQQALRATKELATHLRTPGAGLSRGQRPARGAAAGAADAVDLYLILREAVGNALTHAGAEDITISLRTRRDTMVAEVADDGSGVGEDVRDQLAGLGLRSMRERAALLGGSFSLTPGPTGGTSVTVTVPLAGR